MQNKSPVKLLCEAGVTLPSKDRVRERRKAAGLTQAALAKRLQQYIPGIDDSDISRIETGRRALKADEVPYFAKALGCKPEELLDDAD